MRHIKPIIAALFLISPFAANAVPILTNGSLTGAIANGGVPAGWTILNPSPDTMDENNNVGGNFGGFGATPSASPDGGTWVGFADAEGGFIEIFGQSVSGFDVGTAYAVSWYQANFGFTPIGFINPDSIGLMVDGAQAGFSSISAMVAGWTLETVQFTATMGTHMLSFGVGENAGRSYMSIDGISIAGVVTVPEPGTLALFGLGLAGMGLARRRKKV